MRFISVIALVVVVCAADNHFKQPKFPCAYQMELTWYRGESKVRQDNVEFNGRYCKVHMKVDVYEVVALLRPDIGGGENMTGFQFMDGECEMEHVGMEEFAYVVDTYGSGMFRAVDDKKWDHKEKKTWRGQKCDHYYNDKKDSVSIYVYDDHIYGLVEEDYEVTVKYKWEAPMKDFVLSKKDYPKCYEKDKKVAEEPSEDYVFCTASTMKVAFLAVFVALVSALF